MIARRLLPASPSSLLDRQDRAITSARPRSVSRHVGRPRRRNHDGRATRTGGLVKADRIVGGIRRHPSEGAVGRLDQRDASRRVVNARLRQGPGDDHTRSVDTKMPLLPASPPVERSRWDDQKDQQDWAPSMEEGGRLSSTGPRRERVLPVQVDSRRSTSKSDSRSASCRISACVQRAQSNDRAWSTRVVRDRSVTNLRVGALGASFDLRNNARAESREST